MKMRVKYFTMMLLLIFFSCNDLEELNENPNGVVPEDVNPNFVMPTVLTEASKLYLNLGFGNVAGVVQHTQKDAWFSEHNDYDWGDQSWTDYYAVLRNNKVLYERAVTLDMEFHQGVALVVRAMMFGLITDLWGDAPYTHALNGDQEGIQNMQPEFDGQETIYKGILEELKKANTLLSKDADAYKGIVEGNDVIYDSDPAAWRKMANALALRYYMRISNKLPDFARQGIEEIIANPGTYPIITTADEDAVMDYVGNNAGDAWPSNTVYEASGSNYRRIKMCATLVDRLQALHDPRLAIWANKVEIPLVVDAALEAGTDKVVDGVRYLSPDQVEGVVIDTDPEYVGLPASVSSLPSAYNLNPTPGQTSYNVHVSYLNERYKQAKGDLLKARLISAAEVHFILAEAALKGWAVGSAEDHYEAGIAASFETWQVSDDLASYRMEPDVAYNGTVEQVMEQKWIASWSAATEAWFDYRRTGLPALEAGASAKREVLPVRFYYMRNEINLNAANTTRALDRLEVTGYTQADGKNSAWSKQWLLQGTEKPW